MTTDALEVRVAQWLLSDDTGTSSKTICAHMFLGAEQQADFGYPDDVSDLGRCLRLLDKVPEWEPRIVEMARYGGAWIGLCEAWHSLKSSMESEVGLQWEKGEKAPVTYHKLKLAIADGYRRDPNYKCTFNRDGYLSSASLTKPNAA